MGGSGGGGSTTSTTVQKADPWSGVQPNIKDIVGRADTLSQTPREFFPGQTYVNRDPMEDMAQQAKLSYGTQGVLPQIGATMRAQNDLLNATDVASNPYVNDASNLITSKLNRQFAENILPGVEQGAIAAGQLGGSRQGVAEGIAARGLQEANAAAQAQLYADAYDAGLQQQARGVLAAPQTMQLGFMPAQAMAEAGAYNRGEQEMALAEQMARHEFAQSEPWERLGAYNSFVQGMPWSQSATSTGTAPGRSGSTFGNALGGAMTGYGMMTGTGMLGSMMGAGGLGSMMGLGAAAGPVGLVGGALLGGLLS